MKKALAVALISATALIPTSAALAGESQAFLDEVARESARIAALPADKLGPLEFMSKADAIEVSKSLITAGVKLAPGDDGFIHTSFVHIGGGKTATTYKVVLAYVIPPLHVHVEGVG